MDLDTIFTPEEKAALQLLCTRGFEVYTEAKLEDVKELNGTRHRTFRNQGRYDLALMLKNAQAPVAQVVDEIKLAPEVVEVSAVFEAEKVELEPEPVKADEPEPKPVAEKPKKKTGRKKKPARQTFKPR